MKNPLDQLTSLERRFVIGVGVVLFIVLNAIFVLPQFKKWDTTKARISENAETLRQYQEIIAQVPKWQKEVDILQSAGGNVPPEDQANEFLKIIQNTEIKAQVRIASSIPQRAPTNAYFLEQIQSIQVSSGEPELVDFLYQLSEGNSLIRVRDINIRRDPSGHKLTSNIKLVASYQKNATRAPAAPVTTPKAKTEASVPVKKGVPAPGKSPTEKASKS